MTQIKSVSWEYSCVEEYLVELDKGKILKYYLLPAVLQRNRLDPMTLPTPLAKLENLGGTYKSSGFKEAASRGTKCIT